MAIVMACGFECGSKLVSNPLGTVAHFTTSDAPFAFSTTTVKDSLRSLRVNPSTQFGTMTCDLSTGNLWVASFDLYFATLPNVGTYIAKTNGGVNLVGLVYDHVSGELRCNVGDAGATGPGVAVTTGVWYHIDLRINTGGPRRCEARVDGVALATAEISGGASGTTFQFGCSNFQSGQPFQITGDWFIDNVIVANASTDYPLRECYIVPWIPVADGTHSIATQAFRRGLTATAIDNSTTDAYELINDLALPAGSPSGDDFIAATTDTGAGADYVEVIMGAAPGIDSIPDLAPIAIDAICAFHQADGSSGNIQVLLVDNNVEGTILSRSNTGFTTYTHHRALHLNGPGGQAWNLMEAGPGSLKNSNIKVRYKSSDGAPDQYLDAVTLELLIPRSDMPPGSIPDIETANSAHAYTLITNADYIDSGVAAHAMPGYILRAGSVISNAEIVEGEPGGGGEFPTITEGQGYPNGFY